MRWDATRARYFAGEAPPVPARVASSGDVRLTVASLPVDPRVQKTLGKRKRGGESAVCVICQEALLSKTAVLNCGHGDFHVLCLEPWMQRTGSCPVCRAPIDTALAVAESAALGQ